MSKKISGAEYPLAKIFSSEFEYQIPSYQRPYAWTVDETSELFDDLYDFYKCEQEETYFLGSIVLIKEEGKPHAEVIDGQQRLTTLTILLAALTSELAGDLRTDFENYIREPGRASQGLKPKPRLTLRERDSKFFTKYVQDLNFNKLLELDPVALKNESQKNIQSNGKLILRRLSSTFPENPKSENPKSENQEQLCAFGSFIVQRCFLVAVSTPSQQSAFRVFSVMNSRGLDLQPTDIIKAEIIGKFGSEEERDGYSERWEDMEVELGRSGFNDLFSYIRMIYAKEKAKRALLEEFKEHVIPKVSNPNKLIEDILEPYTSALAITKNANYEASSDAQNVNGYLKWLNRIDNSDWIPPAILFLSKQKHDPKYVSWFFIKLERLAAFMHVCAKNINERIDRYGKLIVGLEKDHNFESHVNEVELTESEKESMAQALNGNIYELTARRRNYIILRLDSFLSDGAASYDSKILTIEHVLPQTVDSKSEWAKLWQDDEQRQAWVHRIANLVPLNQRRNSQARNFDFEKKKKAYFSGNKQVSSYILTTQVLKSSTWTPDLLKERQEELMDVMKKNWELNKVTS